ncbi:MAG: hypothetical protein HYX27_28280 [Acidobacteria bacterium]|nr:hypothetical protein [Acidobacteriota bacterium]
MRLTLLLISALAMSIVSSAQGPITAIAGNGSISSSGDGGPATSAGIGFPKGVAVDAAGNVYILDALNNRVRKVDSAGTITTAAGNGFPLFSGDGGPAKNAGFAPVGTATHQGVAVDKAGNFYLVDAANSRIRKVDTAGVITTFAGSGSLGNTGFSGDGGPAINAQLSVPFGVAFDSAGNLYIADTGNGRIRKVDTSGIITTVAGRGNGSTLGDGGPATNAQLANPSDVAVDNAGNIYIADFGHSAIRKVNPSGTISSILRGGFGNCQPGSMPAAAADIGSGVGLTVDSAGNLYIADASALCIHKLDTSGTVTTYAGGGSNFSGDGIPATSIGLGKPNAVAVDAAGNLYIADSSRFKVFKVAAGPVPTPVVAAALNAASFATGQPLVQGSLASVFGTALAPSTVSATAIPLPPSLGGVSVTIGGVAAPLLFVSSGQINLQVPWTLQNGTADIVVTVNNTASAAFKATVGGVAPGIFSTQFGAGPAIAINPDGSLAAAAGSIPGIATRPAKAGETIILLGTGLGLVTPAITTGAAASDILRRTIITPSVLIGGVTAQVLFSGLSPQFVGVNQLNVVVPNLPAGTVSLQIDEAGVRSTDKVTIAVANP